MCWTRGCEGIDYDYDYDYDYNYDYNEEGGPIALRIFSSCQSQYRYNAKYRY